RAVPTKSCESSTSPRGRKVLPHVSHHSETVTGISVAKQLPFLATCSSDKVLRVFNFATRSVVAQRVYDEEVLSCAIHPSGLFVVITLEFFAKVYALFPDQQQFFKVCDLDVRGCHEVAYSNGGGRLAFAVGNKVQIYDAHKFRHQGSLVGHTVMIKSVSWSNNDGRITTSDMIGTICCWNTSTYLRDGLDASQNSLVIQCARFHEGTGLIAAIGSNKHASSSVFEGEFTIVCSNPHNTQGLVLLRPGIVLPKAMSSRKLHAKLIAFATVSQTLFVGTPTGRILMYSWPPLRNARPYDYIDAHACEVLHLLLSPDERFLFSVGSDNTMFTFHLEQIRGGKYVGASAFNHRMYDELVFGLRSTLDAYSRDAAALKMLTAESREQHAIAMQGVEDAEADALVQLRKEREKEGERLKKRLETLKAEKSVVDKQAIQEGHAVESSYNSAAEALENLYAKLQEETAMRYQQLEFEKDEVTIRFEATVAKKLGQNQRELSELETVRSLREHVLLEEVKAWEQQEKRSTVTVDAVVCQTVVDYEHELIDVEKQHKQSMKRNDELVLRAMLAASVGDREVDRLKKEIGVLQTQLDGRKHTIRDLQQLLERRSKETVELKQGMQAKQEAINVAERKMQQMKHQLTALENLRFVLTHQYETLEGDVQPKDDKIAELETTVVQVEKDLLVADEDRTALRVKNSQLRSDVLGLEDDRLVIRKDSMDASRRLETLLSNLSLAVSSFRDPLQFGVALHKLVTAQQQGGATSPSTSPKKKKAAAQKKPGTGKPLPSALSSKGKESPKKAVSIATTQPRAGDASPAPSLSRAGSLRQLKGSTSDAPASSGVPPPAPSRSTTAVAFEATIDDREVLNKELAAIKERMTLSTVFATSLPKKQQQIMALGNAQMIEDNTTLIHEAKALRIEKTTLQTQLSNHENALRDVRAALHRLAVKNRLLMLTEGPEVEVGMAPPSQQMFSSSYRSVGAASQDERGELVESPVAMAMTTPMLTDAPDAATPATQPKRTKPSSMGRHALPPIASRVLPPTSGAAAPTPLPRSVSAEPPLKTWGGQPLKRKPSSAERAKLEHRAHLEQLLSQLDGDAAKMRDHKRSIHELRGIAQELLRMEEQRLLQELADTTLSASTPVHARHNNTTTGDATNTTSAALVEEPDWVVRHAADGPSADSARPMTPTKPPS
ncbi:WD40 repeat-containing protein, putative, partial [Bodo saltans]